MNFRLPVNRRLSRNHRQGMIAWGTLFSVMFLLILVSLVANSTSTVNRKIDTQNSADAVAYTGAVWLARGMNSLSATNHVMGEINALYTLHHAIGGKWLDDRGNRRNSGDWHAWFYRRSDRSWVIPLWNHYGGASYQLSKWTMWGLYWGSKISSWIVYGLSWTPPFMPAGKIPKSAHYNRVKKDPFSDINSSVFEGTSNLKAHMNIAYGIHLAGALMYIAGHRLFYTPGWPPFANQIKGIKMMRNGKKMQDFAYKYEERVYKEYGRINKLESFAKSIRGAKKALIGVQKVIYAYQMASVNVEIPAKAFLTGRKIAERTGKKGFVLGDFPDDLNGGAFNELKEIFPKMPVEPEKVTDEEKSQMIRATYPWVRYWRKNLVAGMQLLCPLSGIADSYIMWTNKYSRQSSQWLRFKKSRYCSNELTVRNRRTGGRGERGLGIRMYVVEDLNRRGQKGKEPWNQDDGSHRADELFCLMGYVKSARPSVYSPAFFRQENPHGVVCYSQGMVYNANPQKGQRQGWWQRWFGDELQPARGWDTLAWDHWHPSAKIKEFEDPGWFGRFPDRFGALTERAPRIKLNWQAKLSPITSAKFLKTAIVAGTVDRDMRPVLINARETQLLLQNH